MRQIHLQLHFERSSVLSFCCFTRRLCQLVPTVRTFDAACGLDLASWASGLQICFRGFRRRKDIVFSRLREECRKGYCYEEVPGELHTIMRIIENKHSQRMLS